VVAQNSGHSKEGRKQIRDDIKRVVQVDGEEIFVLVRWNVVYVL